MGRTRASAQAVEVSVTRSPYPRPSAETKPAGTTVIRSDGQVAVTYYGLRHGASRGGGVLG